MSKQTASLDSRRAYAVTTVCAYVRAYQWAGVYAIVYACSCIKGAALLRTTCCVSGVKTPFIRKKLFFSYGLADR